MSTPPPKSRESTNRGGLDTTPEDVEMPNENWRETVKVYGELLVEAFDYGVETIQQLLKPWTLEERWGAILEFEALAPEKMERLVVFAPNWVEWCDA
jgi:hypothetical protein